MIVFKEAWSVFRSNFSNFSSIMSMFNFKDVVDIVIIAFIVYQAVRLVRETRAMQLLKGIGAVVALYFVSILFELNTLNFFLSNVLSSGLVVIALVFQPEIRRALEQMGRTKLSSIALGGGGDSAEELLRRNEELVAAVSSAAAYLSARKTGALLVIEREIKLGEIIKTGTTVDSAPSLELIANLFFPNSPLHDGAVVARGGRLLAAGCFLPLSANMEIGRELGTRHRAALGMSEVSDAVVVVVSEETGAISVAVDSRLQRGLSQKNLQLLLKAKLIGSKPEETPSKKKLAFWRKSK